MPLRYRLAAALVALLAPAASAQTPGTCTLGTATADLDIGGVRARLFNNGGLFWKGSEGNVYNVPRSPIAPGVPDALFTHTLWLGGRVDGEVRQSATEYGHWEMWPGPLGADGELPGDGDCARHDRIYTVAARDVAEYDRTGEMTADLRDWPAMLGAPVLDGDGVPGNYNLAGGDRPEILGHQTAFWVMNDVGGTHRTTGSKPIGVEVRVAAFAFRSDDAALDFATAYRYTVVYRGKQPLTDAWLGFFSDPDLGNATDDYVGSDTVLGLGFVYNADDLDEGRDGYGATPPALGYLFLDGPLVRDLDGDGTPDAPGATRFLVHNGNASNSGEPRPHSEDRYKYLQGLWQDGSPMRACGMGDDAIFSNATCPADTPVARFMYPGDPVTKAFWSEFNLFRNGPVTPNSPNDRRFVLSTGPFTLEPGASQSFTLAIVWARGADNLDSVTKLKDAARSVQATYDATGFLGLPQRTFGVAPSAAPVALAPADGATGQPRDVLLRWAEVERAQFYEVEVCDTLGGEGGARCTGTPRTLRAEDTSVAATTAPGRVAWRVRGANEAGSGPWSGVFAYDSSGEQLATGAKGFDSFLVTANAAGPLDPPEFGAIDPNHRGFPRSGAEAGENATAASQVGPATFGIHTGDTDFSDGGFDYFFSRVTRDGGNARAIAGRDYEWRFTGSSIALNLFQDQATYEVPFELWDVGARPGPEDDVRMIPIILENTATHVGLDPAPDGREAPNHVFDLGPDHPTSGGFNDPQTDWVYWYRPADTTPGQAGYAKWVADVTSAAPTGDQLGEEVFARVVLVSFNGGNQWTGPFNQALPEPGTVFRINTSRLRAPVASAPLDGAATGEGFPTLHWQEPAPVTVSSYEPPANVVVWRRVQVATDAAFTALVIDDTTASGPSFTVTRGLVAGTRAYWRVRVRLDYGDETGWSAAASFTPGTSSGADGEAGLPARVTLGAPYPNPFGAASAVRYGLPAAGRVRLALYDVLGRRVAILADGTRAAGWHDAPLDGSALASGVYVVRLEAAGRVVTRSVVRVR